MIKVKHTIALMEGITVGRRKDGSRAVLYSDNVIEWYSAKAFALYFEEI